MPITILSDADVQAILDTITKEDVLRIQRALGDALHQYSTITNAEDSGCAAANQPSRIAVKSRDGGTTLFMPASSHNAFGVKIVTLSETRKSSTPVAALPDVSSVSLSKSSSDVIRKQSSSSRSSSPSFAASKASSSSIRSSSPSTLASKSSSQFSDGSSNFRNGRTPNELDKHGIITPGTPLAPALPSATSPRGSITLLSSTGEPRALINASTITAFRTALVSTMLLKFRASVHDITVFGAGLQAFWHLYVSMLLRGDEIHHINIINRDFVRAQRLLMALTQTKNEAVADVILGTKCRPEILTPEYVEYPRLLKEYVRAADVIFCTTPATEPLFPGSFLTSTEARRKARYIAAIGSYKPHMQELHEDILRQAVRPPSEEHHHGLHMHHRHAPEGGAIIVDSIEGAMREAGEIINAGISANSIVELGELVMLKRGHVAELEERERQEQNSPSNGLAKEQRSRSIGNLVHHHHSSTNNHDKEQKKRRREVDGGLMDWLERGNVVYKGVGIGLMDIVVSMEVVRLAEERGIGTFVEDF